MLFHTVEEVAKELKIDAQMVRYYIRGKRIKAVKHGRKYVVSAEDLNKAVKKGY